MPFSIDHAVEVLERTPRNLIQLLDGLSPPKNEREPIRPVVEGVP